MKENGVNRPERQFNITVRYRFPKYLRVLKRSIQHNITHARTEDIASEIGEKGSNVKQDFFFCEFKGKQNVGYKTKYLYKSIKNKLGFDKKRTAFIIGCNPINNAILDHKELQEYGLQVIGIFDRNPNNVGKQFNDFLVKDISEIPEGIELAIITEEASWREMQELLDFIISKNIKVIWNFSSHIFIAPENILVIDTDLVPAYASIAQNLDRVEKGLPVDSRQYYF